MRATHCLRRASNRFAIGIECSPWTFKIFLALLFGLAGCAQEPAPNGISSQEPLNPHRPDGALNLFCKSIQEGDIVAARTLIDSGSVDVDYGKLRSDALIADAQFFCVAKNHYGFDAAIKICEAYCLQVEVPIREFEPGEFTFSNDGTHASGDVVVGDPASAAPGVLRGADGIWRIWSPVELRFQPQIAFEFLKEDIRMKGRLAQEINTGRDPTPQDLIQRVAPNHPRPAQWQFNPPSQFEITRNVDKATPRGAIGAYYMAFLKHDRSGIVEFFYSDGDPSDELANARAAKIISVSNLKKSVERTFHVGQNDADFIWAEGLTGKGDQPWWGSPGIERHDRTPLDFEDDSELPMRKIAGVWKLDITPPKPQTPMALVRVWTTTPASLIR